MLREKGGEISLFISLLRYCLVQVLRGNHNTAEHLDLLSTIMGGDDYEYVSYKSPKTIMAETVYHFLRGGLYGAAFGMVCVMTCEKLIQYTL